MGETWPPRCYFCKEFMSYRGLTTAIVWTPYGNASTTEPPPEECAHSGCWRKASPERRDLIRSVSWQKPLSNGQLV